MRAIGFRAEKDRVHWVVVDGTCDHPVKVADGQLRPPQTYTFDKGLTWLRDSIRTLLEQHKPDVAAMRCSETYLPRRPKPNSLESMFERCRIEGVAIEAAASTGVSVNHGKLQQIASGMGTKSAKAYVDATEVRGMDIDDLPAKRKEAALAAISALPKEKV